MKQYPGGHQEVSETKQKLLSEKIIEPTMSHKFNSSVWPVKKPNDAWRLTIDYREMNGLSPKVEGLLPDIENYTAFQIFCNY
jgi:hypothetical protein